MCFHKWNLHRMDCGGFDSNLLAFQAALRLCDSKRVTDPQERHHAPPLLEGPTTGKPPMSEGAFPTEAAAGPVLAIFGVPSPFAPTIAAAPAEAFTLCGCPSTSCCSGRAPGPAAAPAMGGPEGA
jgi:hypothetical protein